MHASMPFWELEKSRNIFEISIVFHVLQYVWILSLLPILRLKAKGFLEICIHGSRPTTAGMVGVYWNSRQEGPVEPAAVFFKFKPIFGPWIGDLARRFFIHMNDQLLFSRLTEDSDSLKKLVFFFGELGKITTYSFPKKNTHQLRLEKKSRIWRAWGSCSPRIFEIWV